MRIMKSLALFLAMSVAMPAHIARDFIEDVRTLFEDSSRTIMRRLETNKNIDFGGRVMHINFRELPRLDKIIWQGIYDPVTETLSIAPRMSLCAVRRKAMDTNPVMLFFIVDECHPMRLQHFIAHETGHHYMLSTLKRESYTGWLKDFINAPEKKRPLGELLGMGMVVEGVGEYFGEVLHQPRKPNPLSMFDVDLPYDKLEGLWITYRYDGGYALVKPVLDVDIKRGIRCLVDAPLVFPSGQQALNMRPAIAYQAAMLDCVHKRNS